MEGYDPNKPTSYITYLDANNLYGDAMSNPLPVGKFKFLSQTEIDQFDLMSIPPDGDTGYIIECDLIYPDHLHDEHKLIKALSKPSFRQSEIINDDLVMVREAQ